MNYRIPVPAGGLNGDQLGTEIGYRVRVVDGQIDVYTPDPISAADEQLMRDRIAAHVPAAPTADEKTDRLAVSPQRVLAALCILDAARRGGTFTPSQRQWAAGVVDDAAAKVVEARG